jgi:hypothetical protein
MVLSKEMQGDASTIRAVVEPPNDCLRRLFAHSAHTSRLCPIRALLQGTLDFIVLQTLRSEPQHGFGIGQMIRANSNDALQVDTGSLYPPCIASSAPASSTQNGTGPRRASTSAYTESPRPAARDSPSSGRSGSDHAVCRSGRRGSARQPDER